MFTEKKYNLIKAFGSYLPGRTYNSNDYAYAFNGKRKDPEVVGTSGNVYDYGFRIYNPSLGRFLSTDPLSNEYPWNSTYSYAENDVIRCIDLDGAEKLGSTTIFATKATTLLQVLFSSDVLKKILFTDISQKKNDTKTLVIFTTIKGRSENLGGITKDIGGVVKFIERYEKETEDFQTKWKSQYNSEKKLLEDLDIKENDIKKLSEGGYKIFVVALNENTLDNASFDKTSLRRILKSLAHEINAHLKKALAGQEMNNYENHVEYFDLNKDENKPTYFKYANDLMDDMSLPMDEFPKGSPAAKDLEEIDKAIEKFYQNEPKSTPVKD